MDLDDRRKVHWVEPPLNLIQINEGTENVDGMTRWNDETSPLNLSNKVKNAKDSVDVLLDQHSQMDGADDAAPREVQSRETVASSDQLIENLVHDAVNEDNEISVFWTCVSIYLPHLR